MRETSIEIKIATTDIPRLMDKCEQVAGAILRAVVSHYNVEIKVEGDLHQSIVQQQDLLIYHSLLKQLEIFVDMGYVSVTGIKDLEMRSGKTPRPWEEIHAEKLQDRLQAMHQGKRAPVVVQKGSAGAYSKLVQKTFDYKNRVLDTVTDLNDNVDYIDLNDGASGMQWNKYYSPSESLTEETKLAVLHELITSESENVDLADLVVCPIYTEGLSIFATIEILFILADCMLSGQKLACYIERFDPVAYARAKTIDKLVKEFKLVLTEPVTKTSVIEEFRRVSKTNTKFNLNEAEAFIQILFAIDEVGALLHLEMPGGLLDPDWLSSVVEQGVTAMNVRRRVKEKLAQMMLSDARSVLYFNSEWEVFAQKLQVEIDHLGAEFQTEAEMVFPDQIAVPELKVGVANATNNALKPEGYPDRSATNASEFNAPIIVEQQFSWIDNPEIDAELKQVLVARAAPYHPEGIQFEEETNRPINPLGNTKVTGRGELGKWGANPAADPIITRIDPTSGLLQLLTIKRKNGGQWAIPGGMADHPGEATNAVARRELSEETGVEITEEKFMSKAVEVYRGPVDDPRNTNNAWMTTSAFHYHVDPDEVQKKPEAGDDAAASEWITITPELLHGLASSSDDSLYANHEEFVLRALALFYNSRAGSLPPKTKRQILGLLPH